MDASQSTVMRILYTHLYFLANQCFGVYRQNRHSQKYSGKSYRNQQSMAYSIGLQELGPNLVSLNIKFIGCRSTGTVN